MSMMNMFKYIALFLTAALSMAFSTGAFAQQMSPEEKEKKMDEFIQKQVSTFESSLKLESWQTFYVDSILTHDFHALQDELDELSKSKVSNADIYVKAQDKWSEQMYNSIKAILNETQWNKYLKMGAGRDKKLRDKRKAKSEGK